MPRLKTATARMSQPNVSPLRGPWRPSSGTELGVLVSNELKYEIASMPSRYGQSQTALRQSSDRFRAVESVAVERASSAKPIRIAAISFQTTAQPVKSRISLAATNVAGASNDAAASLKGRGRSGSWRLRAPSASGAIAYTATAAAEERECDREERRSAWREASEGRGDKAVASECEGEARARARVDQTGASRRDDCIRVKQDSEPAQAECRRQCGEGPEPSRERDRPPTLRELRRVECQDKRHL